MKKIIASALFLGFFTFGCDLCDDQPPYFNIVGLTIQDGNYSLNATGDSSRVEHFEIIASFEQEYYSQNAGFSLIPSARAHSCPEAGYKGSKEKIESIEIFALSDYNSHYKTGALLNPVMRMGNVSVEDFVARLDYSGIETSRYPIRLTQDQNPAVRPDSTIKQAFRVTLKLTNGETYTADSRPIIIY